MGSPQLPQQPRAARRASRAIGLHHTSRNVPVAPQRLHRLIVVAGAGGLVEQGAPGVLVLQDGTEGETCGDMSCRRKAMKQEHPPGLLNFREQVMVQWLNST